MPAEPQLPSPTVEFTPALLRRFGAFSARLAATREREEVGRRRALSGVGDEFVGHRPYRPGEDLRQLDWTLFARLDRPFVQIRRPSAREMWIVAVDASASMGVGIPGKLQSAAEAAAASMAVGLRIGATIALALPAQDRVATPPVCLNGRADLGRGLDLLAGLVASGENGLERLLDPRNPSLVVWARRHGAGRALLFGDFLDVDPEPVLRLARGARRVHVGQVFAPEEWDPAFAGPLGSGAPAPEGSAAGNRGPDGVVWMDPESPSTRRAGDGHVLRYLERLEAFVEKWSMLSRDHGLAHAVWRSDEAFEAHLPALLR